MKPKVNQKSKYKAHFRRVEQYIRMVMSLYEEINAEIAKSVASSAYDGTMPFRFSDFPNVEKAFMEMEALYVRGMEQVVLSGTSEEWRQSNIVQDMLASKTLRIYGVEMGGEMYQRYFQTNNDALKAFQRRRRKGMNISDRLWRDVPFYRSELEDAISAAVEKGTGAVKLSKRISKYLIDYPKLKKDYTKKYGKAVNCIDCEYRSIRLARTEINMAYRSAEQLRWNQMDFVLGYEIKITHSHKHVYDICDEMKGVYPKTFKFAGWHPNCMCYVVPVLKTEEQFFGYEDAPMVDNAPKGFYDYIAENSDRIKAAKERGTLPYWYLDNKKYIAKV